MSSETVSVLKDDQYRVDLDVFNGPLDLLLYLIRKEEVEIYEIPIARITRQYLRYVETMSSLNLEVAGEFILMAATLIRIKTRLLLPRDDEEGDEVDPREELIMALVEYRKYKEASNILKDRALQEERVYVPPNPVATIKGRVDLEPVTSLYDLIVAFREVMAPRKEITEHNVVPEEISIEERMNIVLRLVKEKDGVPFIELFSDLPRRIIAVVTFLALLELARARRITLRQTIPYAELRVYRGERLDDEHDSIDLVDGLNKGVSVAEETTRI